MLMFLGVFGASPLRGQVFYTEKGHVEFLSEAPVETIVGQSDYLTGQIDLEKGKVDFYVDLTTLKTGISLRDEHMRENHLETDTYPFAEFSGAFDRSTNLQRQLAALVLDSLDVSVSGNFSVHGITKEIHITGKAWLRDKQLHLLANWELLLSDYDITIPQFLFLKLSNTQKITIQASLERQ